MPNNAQAIKRLRQDARRNLRNRIAKSEIRTFTKKVLSAVEAGDAKTAQELLQLTQAKLDKAAKRNVMHANMAARRKSALGRAVAGMNS